MCDTPTDWVQHFTMRPTTILIMQKSLQMCKQLWITVWKEKKQQSLSYLIHNTKKEENERQYKKCDYDEQVYSLGHNKKI